MVRAMVDFEDADYERLRKAANDRGVAVEALIAAEAVRALPEVPEEEAAEPFESWEAFFAWCDQKKFGLKGWKWNREELYER